MKSIEFRDYLTLTNLKQPIPLGDKAIEVYLIVRHEPTDPDSLDGDTETCIKGSFSFQTFSGVFLEHTSEPAEMTAFADSDIPKIAE